MPDIEDFNTAMNFLHKKRGPVIPVAVDSLILARRAIFSENGKTVL